MRCSTEIRPAFALGFWLALSLALLGPPPSRCVAAPGDLPGSEAPAVTVRGSEPSLTEEQCRAIAVRLGDPAERADALAELERAPFFPVRIWVDLLNDPDLAVRLGALEILEDRAATDLDYDPWEHDPVRRRELWSTWDEWAKSGGKAFAPAAPALGAGAMQSYLRDIVGGDRDKTERALGKMQPYARTAIAVIETYLSRQSDPSPGLTARLREAQFRLLLDSVKIPEARRIARDLASGNRDAKIESLDLLAEATIDVLPLIGESLRDEDPLVRERAMDVLLSIGKAEAIPLAVAHLEKDPDPNVAHAAIRAFGRIEGRESVEALVPYLESDDEDVVSTALQSLSLLGDAARSAKPDIGHCLSHESWRVRAAALQFLLKTRSGGYQKEILSLLTDPDSFVRSTAVQASLAATGSRSSDPFGSDSGKALLKETEEALLSAVTNNPDLQGPVFRAFDARDLSLPDSLLDLLKDAEREVRVTAMQALDPRGDREFEILEAAINGGDPDLSAAALRVLAKSQDHSDQTRALLVEALTSPSSERRSIVLEHLRWEGPKATSRSRWSNAWASFRGEALTPEPSTPDPAEGSGTAGALLDAFGLGTPTPAPANPSKSETASPEEESASVSDQLMDAFGIGPHLSTEDGDKKASSPTPLASSADALMDAFGIASPPPEEKAVEGGNITTIEAALDRISDSAPLVGDEADSVEARKATSLLVQGGSDLPVPRLLRSLTTMDVQYRAELAADLGDLPQPGFLPLWAKLLHDPSAEVRQRALRSALDDDYPVLVQFALEEAFSPESPAEAPDLYSRYLEYLCDNDDTRKVMAEIGRELIADDRPVPSQVLGLIILRNAQSRTDRERLVEKLDHEDYWIRRAALISLGRESTEEIEQRFPEFAADKSVWVREAAATVFGRDLQVWTHHFSDTVQLEDEDHQGAYEFSSSRGSFLFAPSGPTSKLAPRVVEGLKSLTRDLSANVRLAAWMSLLANREEVDVDALTQLLSQSPDRETWQKRLGAHLAENVATLGPALAPLLAYIDPKVIDEERLAQLRNRLRGPTEFEPRLDFSDFVASNAPPPPPVAGKNAQFVTPEENPTPAPDSAEGNPTSATLVFFYNPGCHECDAVREDLDSFRKRFTALSVEEFNIRETKAVILNEALCTRFSIDPTLRQVTPAVFMQEGALIKDEIDRPALQELIQRTLANGDRGDWLDTGEEEIESARETVENRFATFGLAGVILAGLLDGINPCAFATMIFLLSYLQVSRRSSREILAVGGAFITAVFLSYFALGLGLVEIVGRLNAFRTAGRILNLLLAAACLWIAWMSFRDARLARQGRLADMSLQLPEFLKTRIRSVIRTGARSRRFVVAAFLSGIIISVLELACTGQVYLPTIVYAMKSGAGKAVWYLAAYNVAFILPLTAIFVMAWRGLKSEALVRFQQRHTASVKIALGCLFLLLFAALLWSGRIG